MDAGTTISGAGHGLLLAFLMFGGLLQPRDEEPEFNAADVSLISAEEFAALQRPEVEADAPDATVAVPEPEEPVVEDSPAPTMRPEAPVEQPEPPAPEAPEPPQDTPVEAEEPPAPEAEVTDTPPEEIAPPVEDTAIPDITPPAEEAAPRDIPRVAPIPVPEAPDVPEIADTPAPRVDENADSDQQAEEQPEAAPEEATTEIATEANRAPASSPAPTARPAPPPTPAPVTEEVEEPVEVTEAPEPPAETPEETPDETPAPDADPLADAIAGAVADAVSETTSAPPASSTAAGPPLNNSEREGLRVAVQQCWNLGASSTDAMRTTVIVGVSMNLDGTPDTGSIRLISSEGGTQDSVTQAYEAARRAIIRCGARGFPLPEAKYDHWRDIEMTFNPDGMRLR